MKSLAKREALAIEKITKCLNTKKGVGGLEILLSVVAMLFVIGILVMSFVLVGGKLMTSTDDADAKAVINDTKNSIASVTDWFPIIIVITAIVVIILLLVVVIMALRGSGMMGG